MTKRRSRVEIKIDILKAVLNERSEGKPTRIVTISNTSWKTLTEILKELDEGGLIVGEAPSVSNIGRKPNRSQKIIWRVTPEGREALKSIRSLLETV